MFEDSHKNIKRTTRRGLALSHIKTYTTVTSKSLILEENREYINRSQCINKFGVFRSAQKYNLVNGTGIPQNMTHVH